MDRNAKPILILTVAVALLFVLSFFGWEDLSGGLFKSFDIFADVRPGGSKAGIVHGGNEYLDPDLAALDNETLDYEHYEYIDDEGYTSDSSSIEDDSETEQVDAIEDYPAEEDVTQPEPAPTLEGTSESSMAPAEEAQHKLPAVVEKKSVDKKSPVKDKTVTAENDRVAKVSAVPAPDGAGKFFEDFSQGHSNTAKLRKMLASTSDKLKRIAVIGDSYIEGDIFTEGVRELMQDSYGGCGIGYTPLFSEIPGFRRSVVHSCSGFENLDFRTRANRPYSLMQGVASKADEEAAATFSGTNKVKHGDSWSSTTLLLKAPQGGSLRVKAGKGKDARWQTYSFQPSGKLQSVRIDTLVSRASIAGITPGIVFMGAYLDGDKGIAVDNMSIRGYSGIRHDEIDATLVEEARPFVNYDLIVLEYGINALSSNQTNYDAYAKKMTQVVNHLKKLYPEAVIMIMGIGDRGEKIGGEVHSMTTAKHMVDAQRRIARDTGSLFWDTRAAMGGDDAVVEWAGNKEINKDYIHLSFAGGKHLARLFMESLDATLKQK